jgi:major membrane immunogen (membrane-anchored lipoprotein)
MNIAKEVEKEWHVLVQLTVSDGQVVPVTYVIRRNDGLMTKHIIHPASN